MAVNAYLFVDGVTGPSTSKTGAIDILSFSFGASNSSTYGVGSSGQESTAGRVDFQNLTIMKVLDATSPILSQHCWSGDILKDAYIIYDKPIGADQADYFRVYLGGPIIVAIQQTGSSENPTESVTFAFQQVEVAYKPQQDDGTLGGTIAKGFDLSTLLSTWAAPTAF
jgi:type VI secretion system secreted protein Hcp